MAATNPVPLFYQVVFTFVDPAFCVLGMYMHLSDVSNTLSGYSPSFTDPPTIETVHMLDTMAGFFAMLGLLEAILLRVRGRDTTVWRVVQGTASLIDVFMVYAVLKALRSEGRMDISVWRGDEWRLVAGNAGIGLIRIACALGVGMSSEDKAKRA